MSNQNDKTRCMVNSILFGKNTTPFIGILLDALSDAGCPVKPEIHIAIEDCSACLNITGAFDSFNNQIVLCQNRLNELSSSKSKLSNIQVTLSHELIHAYDHCRARVDFYNNPAHVMCSEIRAASLSGQCMFSENAFASTLSGFKSYHQSCVKKAALSSFKALHPDWDKKKSETLLEKLFMSCYEDVSPFDEIPFSKKHAERTYKYQEHYRNL